MKTDLEIAHEAEMCRISQLLDTLELSEEHFEYFGKYTGKIRLGALEALAERPDGKLILITAMTPTRKGEGKTLTTVGMGQALGKLGLRGMATLREPSLGPVFGMKGGATGGGYSQLLPMEHINLHFNGDIHAVTTAHNLLTALLDNHLHRGNELGIDSTRVAWHRAIDMNDRALRKVVIGLGGRGQGVPRESGFVITAASEIMAILALADSRPNLKERLGEIIVGYRHDASVVRARDLGAEESLAVVLKQAIRPNLVQTLEHTPALVHAGPFANIAHGTCSVLPNRMALKLADYVVTECGFGADLGAEKFFDIVCRHSGLWPSAVVLVATTRALKVHGGASESQAQLENMTALEGGLENLTVHVENVLSHDVPVVVALNHFDHDTKQEIAAVRAHCEQLGVEFAPHDAFARGGEGAAELTEKAVGLADAANSLEPKYTYELEQSVEEKVRAVAKAVYRADDVYFERRAQKRITEFVAQGYGHLPVCIAKTASSLSDQSLLGVPRGWELTVTDAQLSAGAGFIVILCGNILLMPGLPKVPAANRMTIDDTGIISGLF